jgi:hypothetical protein
MPGWFHPTQPSSGRHGCGTRPCAPARRVGRNTTGEASRGPSPLVAPIPALQADQSSNWPDSWSGASAFFHEFFDVAGAQGRGQIPPDPHENDLWGEIGLLTTDRHRRLPLALPLIIRGPSSRISPQRNIATEPSRTDDWLIDIPQTGQERSGILLRSQEVRDLVCATVPWYWPTPPGHADDDSVRLPLQGSPRAWPREPVGQAGRARVRVETSHHGCNARPFARSRGKPWNIDHWGGQTCGCQQWAMDVGPLVA